MIQAESTITTQQSTQQSINNHHSTTSHLSSELEESIVTDQERQKADELVSRLEIAVGQIFPRDGANAALITTMIQSLNGLRSLLGIVRPH